MQGHQNVAEFLSECFQCTVLIRSSLTGRHTPEVRFKFVLGELCTWPALVHFLHCGLKVVFSLCLASSNTPLLIGQSQVTTVAPSCPV